MAAALRPAMTPAVNQVSFPIVLFLHKSLTTGGARRTRLSSLEHTLRCIESCARAPSTSQTLCLTYGFAFHERQIENGRSYPTPVTTRRTFRRSRFLLSVLALADSGVPCALDGCAILVSHHRRCYQGGERMESKPLAGQVALVTGSSSGIGAATARELARRGARLVLAARRADLLDAEAQAIKRSGGEAIAIPTDVTDTAQ